MTFIYSFLQRILSGAHNGAGYAKKKNLFLLLSAIMLLFPILTFQPHWLFYVFMIVNAVIVYMKVGSFKLFPKIKLFQKYFDIHLWENFMTGAFNIYLVFAHYNILLIMCAVYPALIIHKGFINIGSKLPFFATKTDDPTGKTYGFKLFPNLKIKRGSNSYRLIMAGLSLFAVSLIYLFGWSVTI